MTMTQERAGWAAPALVLLAALSITVAASPASGGIRPGHRHRAPAHARPAGGPSGRVTSFTDAEFSAVSADSATDVWAVGQVCSAGCSTISTLTAHWDGSTWSRVPSPSPGGRDGLVAVSADSPADAWAIGVIATGAPLALHWNGHVWSQVPLPSPGPDQFLMNAVSGVSPTNAWAVGTDCAPDCDTTSALLLHWNGRAWSRVATPIKGTSGSLAGVSADSATDAWAAGSAVLHWNGSIWAFAKRPATGGAARLSAVSPTDVWTSGSEVSHWNGTAWTTPAFPDLGSSYLLMSISGRSAKDAWAVGYAGTKTLTLHWNGTTLTRVPSLSPKSAFTQLSGVTDISANDAWAVGFYCTTAAIYCGTGGENALILHWNGSKWVNGVNPAAQAAPTAARPGGR
jgi:hypothetical protein